MWKKLAKEIMTVKLRYYTLPTPILAPNTKPDFINLGFLERTQEHNPKKTPGAVGTKNFNFSHFHMLIDFIDKQF